MLAIPLVRLEREGALEIQAEMPPDDPSWEGTKLRFSAPLSIAGKAQMMSSGQVVVRLSLRASLEQECRRCLEPVEGELHMDIALLFAPDVEEGDEEVRLLPSNARELDLREAIREEVILQESPFVLCRPECRGLCPQCGVNLNEETCQCAHGEPDPRWDALRALKREQE